MSYRKKIKIILLVGILSIIVSFIVALPEKVGICDPSDHVCIGIFIDRYNIIASILVALFVPVLLISLILYFLSEQIFTSWFRFAKYYLPIAAILIILSPTVDSSILGFDKEFMTWLFSGIFFLTSLGIIIFKRRSLGHPVSK